MTPEAGDAIAKQAVTERYCRNDGQCPSHEPSRALQDQKNDQSPQDEVGLSGCAAPVYGNNQQHQCAGKGKMDRALHHGGKESELCRVDLKDGHGKCHQTHDSCNKRRRFRFGCVGHLRSFR